MFLIWVQIQRMMNSILENKRCDSSMQYCDVVYALLLNVVCYLGIYNVKVFKENRKVNSTL